jgi:hypothetical protein
MKKFKAGTFRLLHGGVYKVLATFAPEEHREHRAFTYLEAGPNSHYSGLFFAFPADISKYTLVPIKEVPGVLRNLEKKKGLIVFDEERWLVHVKGMLKRQLGTQTLNDDNAAGIVHYTERMPDDSRALISFMEENCEIEEFAEILADLSPPVSPRGHPPGAPTNRLSDSQTKDFQTSDSETMKHTTVIAGATTPASSTPSSTSTPDNQGNNSSPSGEKIKGVSTENKGNGHGQLASKETPASVTAILKKLPSGQQVAIENAWKEIQEGKVPRPKVREAIKKVGWLSESELALVVPERGGPGDWLSEAAV